MKITRLERTAVCVPFVPGILPSPEFEVDYNARREASLDERRQDILRIRTDEGVTGIGISGCYYGDREAQAPEGRLIGRDPIDVDPRDLRGVGGGYDIALLDLMGKVLGWPLYRFFGGKVHDRIPVSYWITRMGPDASAAAAARAAALGFRSIKIKCALDDANVAERAHAMHEAAPGLRIVMDAKCRFYTVERALELAREIEACDVIFEDPIPKDNMEDYRRLKESTKILIALHLQNPKQLVKAIHMGAMDGVNIGPSGWGFLDVARIAQAAGIPVWQASNVDLGVSDAFRMHASAAAANCTLGSDLSGNFVHEHSLLAGPLVVDGYAVVSDKPGLGIELDEDAVERYTVR